MKNFLRVVVMSMVMLDLGSLSAMEGDTIIAMDPEPEEPQSIQGYLQLLTDGDQTRFQSKLESLCNGDNVEFACAVSRALYVQAVEDLNQLMSPEFENFMIGLQESVYKMALRFAYARLFQANVDDLDVVSFLNDHKKYWVNTQDFQNRILWGAYHKLLEDKYLKYLLPILEPALGIEVTSLHLEASSLEEIPRSLRMLRNLQAFDISHEHTLYAKVVWEIRQFKTDEQWSIPEWLTTMSSLKTLAVGADMKIPQEFLNKCDRKEITLFIVH